MMTKKQYANHVINKYCTDNDIDRDLVDNWDQYVFSSSRLGVALEYLGMLTDNAIKEYISNRGGLEASYTEIADNKVETFFLTTREILDMLPETL